MLDICVIANKCTCYIPGPHGKYQLVDFCQVYLDDIIIFSANFNSVTDLRKHSKGSRNVNESWNHPNVTLCKELSILDTSCQKKIQRQMLKRSRSSRIAANNHIPGFTLNIVLFFILLEMCKGIPSNYYPPSRLSAWP